MTVYSRFVAIGDSTVEGLDDRYPDDPGYRGWADRLAARLAEQQPGLLYANLAVRGRLVGQVRAEQLGPALQMRPDLVAVVAGLNDVLRPKCDMDAVIGDLEAIFGALTAQGARVVTFTMPDPGAIMPMARSVRPRLALYNDGLRMLVDRHGGALADFDRHPVAGDARLWSPDRLHANTPGHAMMADALAYALDLPGSDDTWDRALPPAQRRRRHQIAAREARWAGQYMVPWIVRRLRGRSSGDGIVAKRPQLTPVLDTAGPGGADDQARPLLSPRRAAPRC